MVSREELTAWISCPSTRQAHGTRLFPTWLWHSAWHGSFPSLRPSPQLHGGTPLGNLCFAASTLKAQSGFFFSCHEQEGDPKAPRFPWEQAGFWSRSAPTQQVVFTGHARVTQASSPKKNRTGAKKRGKFRRKRCRTDGQEMQTLHPLTLMSSCCCLSCSWSMAGGGSWEMRAWVSSIHGFSSS